VHKDTIKPKVSAATPTGTGIGRGTNIAVTFSVKMSPTSITKSTFKLLKVTSSGTTQVTHVTVTLSSDGLKATLNPFGTSTTLLAARIRYKAVVTTGAKDLAGNALHQDSTTAGNQRRDGPSQPRAKKGKKGCEKGRGIDSGSSCYLYSPEKCVEVEFSEVPEYGMLRMWSG
jgi:hypothetical protein